MYEIVIPSASINLPCEFRNPPLYLLRHETNPRVMARRLGLAMTPTLRDEVRVGQVTPAIMAQLSPAAAAAVSPAYAPSSVVMLPDQSTVQVQPTGLRPSLPFVQVPRSPVRFRRPAAQRQAGAPVLRTPRAVTATVTQRPTVRYQQAPARGTVQRKGSGLF